MAYRSDFSGGGGVRSYSSLGDKTKSYGGGSAQFGSNNPNFRFPSLKGDTPKNPLDSSLKSRSTSALANGTYGKPILGPESPRRNNFDDPGSGIGRRSTPEPKGNPEMASAWGALADGSSPIFQGIQNILGSALAGAQQGSGYTPFNYEGFSHNGPSVDDILSGLLDQYGSVFDRQESNLESRKANALAAIEQSYAGLQDDLGESQGAVDERYKAQQAEMDENAAQAQAAIGEGNADTQARQAQLAQMLGTADAIDNSAANEDEQYYAARQAADDAAAQNLVSGSQTRDFNANQNAITTAGFASPEMQYHARGNYDSALGELDTARNQFQQAAYQQALNQYNQDRSFGLQEWQAGRDQAYQNWSNQNQADQSNDQMYWQEAQAALDRDLQRELADKDNAARAGQVNLDDMTNEEQLLYRLQNAGVSNSGATRWYNELLDQVSGMKEGTNLKPTDITNAHNGSSQAESHLVDYARKMGWL